MVLRRMDMMQGNRINRAKSTAKIIVVGVGGAGNNAVSSIAGGSTVGVEFVGMDTDKASLYFCGLPKALQIGRKLTGGLGAVLCRKPAKRRLEKAGKRLQLCLKALTWHLSFAGWEAVQEQVRLLLCLALPRIWGSLQWDVYLCHSGLKVKHVC